MLEEESRSQIAYVCFCMKKWKSIAHLETHSLKEHKEFSNHFNCYLRSNIEYYILKKIKEEHQKSVPRKKKINQTEDLQQQEKLKSGPRLRSQSIEEKENESGKSMYGQTKKQSKSIEPISQQEQSFDQVKKVQDKPKKVKIISNENKLSQRGRPRIIRNTELTTLLSYFDDEVAILTFGEPRILFDFGSMKKSQVVLPRMVTKYIKSWRLDSTSRLFPIFKQTRNRLIILNTLLLCQYHFGESFKLQPPFESYYTQLLNYFLLTFVPFILRDSDVNEWIIKYKAEILLQSEVIRTEIRKFLLWCRRNGDICGDIYLNPRLNFCNKSFPEKEIDEEVAQL